MLAQHALAAGDTVRAARFSIDAARAALDSNAPEEALRLVEQALPVVSTPADRRVLLATRDDAFAALRQTSERLDGLTELAALAEAMRDPAVELDVQLRRASALRMNHDEDEAAELARRAVARAADRGDAAIELRATLELGQALLRTPIGESLGAVAIEVDLDERRACLSPRHRARGADRRRPQPGGRPPRDRDDPDSRGRARGSRTRSWPAAGSSGTRR